MSNIHDQLGDLHRRHSEAWNKYTYFILAITTASIAFALQRSEGTSWDFGLIPLGIAVLSWGASFYCGITEVRLATRALGTNYSLLQLEAGNHPNQPSDPSHIGPAREGITDTLNTTVRKAQIFHVWQLRFYFIGAISYTVWHFMRVAGVA